MATDDDLDASAESGLRTLLQRAVRAYLKSRLRGRTRLTAFLARQLHALQAVPVRIGDCPPLYVDLRDGLARHLLGGDPWEEPPWERDEQRTMRQIIRPGDVAFDIGANLGLHTVLLARLVGAHGQMHAFEPNPELHHALGRTCLELPNSRLHRFALSDQATRTGLLFHPGDHSKVSLADWTAPFGGERRTFRCEVHRIDDLIDGSLLPPPDFIKCDVEGAELQVFKGGARLLDRPEAPIVLFEANIYTSAGFGMAVSSAMDYLSSLSAARYRFFEVSPNPTLSQIDSITASHSNILAVPERRFASTGRLLGPRA